MPQTPNEFAGEIASMVASDVGSFHTIQDAKNFKAKLVKAIHDRDFAMMTAASEAIGGTV